MQIELDRPTTRTFRQPSPYAAGSPASRRPIASSYVDGAVLLSTEGHVK